jgi:hypothetical protein
MRDPRASPRLADRWFVVDIMTGWYIECLSWGAARAQRSLLELGCSGVLEVHHLDTMSMFCPGFI